MNKYKFYLDYLRTPFINEKGQVSYPATEKYVNNIIHIETQQNVDLQLLIEKQILNGGKIYFWSDQHFGHKNIIKYADRPFLSIEEMNSFMLDNFKKTITDNDIVIWGGDVAMMNLEVTKKLLKDLPGKNILILGNHDFGHRNNKYLDYEIFEHVSLGFAFFYKGQKYFISHYPIRNGLLPNDIINIHGHIHDKILTGSYINISVEHTQYKPVLLDEILHL